MSSNLSRRSSRQPLVSRVQSSTTATSQEDTNSLTSFPDPEEGAVVEGVDDDDDDDDDEGGLLDDPTAGILGENDENGLDAAAAVPAALNGLLDTAGRPSMFDADGEDDDDDDPQNLATCEENVLQRIIAHRGAMELVRNLSGLLAERDAQVTALRRLCEEVGVPDGKIAEAKGRVRRLRRKGSLGEAAREEAQQRTGAAQQESLPLETTGNGNGTIRGLTRLFGGAGKRKDSLKPSGSSIRTTSSSRSASVQRAPVKKRTERPKSVDVLSIQSTESSTWNAFTGTIKGISGLGGGGGGSVGGNGGGGGTPTNNREPVEMSTRHDRDQLPPTLSQPSTKDPQEAEWNKFLVRLMKSREQSGEEARSGELLGASRWGHEGNAGKQKLEMLTRLVISGIPMRLRQPIWMELSNTYAIMQPDAYQHYLGLQDNEDPEEIDAILKDVPRTLTSKYDYYAEKGYDRLKKVLIAFVNKYPGLGYTQGLNMIAGYLLLAIADESDAFWVLCNMVDDFFPPDYFSKETSLNGPISDNIVLRQYVGELLPRLSDKLHELEIDPEHTVPLSWFLTAFASVLPETVLLRIWDVWLTLPSQKTFLFNIALTLLSNHTRPLLECETQGEYFAYMSNKCKVSEDPTQIVELIRQAFLMRKKLEGVEVRRGLAVKKLKRHASTEALFTPDGEREREEMNPGE
ncbi:Hypothetical predicted protein [Lecanosticta acicola]|uniref:Rab-GAP TBC domain-containing protein n=1 Tax=Lecanosticta acicola TaxID=111012 RepID=A0AAI8YVT6_9PEZI|nr:Hypothetical predicted protein [Lecanosticta acicola]